MFFIFKIDLLKKIHESNDFLRYRIFDYAVLIILSFGSVSAFCDIRYPIFVKFESQSILKVLSNKDAGKYLDSNKIDKVNNDLTNDLLAYFSQYDDFRHWPIRAGLSRQNDYVLTARFKPFVNFSRIGVVFYLKIGQKTVIQLFKSDDIYQILEPMEIDTNFIPTIKGVNTLGKFLLDRIFMEKNNRGRLLRAMQCYAPVPLTAYRANIPLTPFLFYAPRDLSLRPQSNKYEHLSAGYFLISFEIPKFSYFKYKYEGHRLLTNKAWPISRNLFLAKIVDCSRNEANKEHKCEDKAHFRENWIPKKVYLKKYAPRLYL